MGKLFPARSTSRLPVTALCYVFGRKEYDFWQAQFAADGNGHHLAGYRDSVLPVVEAGQALVVDDYAEIADCLVVAPAPGHTPGHVALWLASGGQ